MIELLTPVSNFFKCFKIFRKEFKVIVRAIKRVISVILIHNFLQKIF
jgi:hypothetical protein